MPRLSSGALSATEAAALLRPLAGLPRVALAVSGGADSTALMGLAARWAQDAPQAPELTVLTVDHGLRPEAAEEAATVCRQAAALGLACHVLRWRGEKPASGVQQAARAARYRLMGRWCEECGAALVTAHTLEDQAETFLMRLARGSGADGLAGMAAQGRLPPEYGDVALFRPFLDVPGARLRATAEALGLTWVQDPSNENPLFERVRVRRALPELARLGLKASSIALSAKRLARARRALERWRDNFTDAHLICHAEGWGELALEPLLALPREIRIRVLGRMTQMFGAGGPGALAELERLEAWLSEGSGRARVLGGARFARRRAALIAGREPGRIHAVLELSPERPAGVWDGRFAIETRGLRAPVRVRALGSPEGQAAAGGDFPARRKDAPAFVWRSLPLILREGRPLALAGAGWRAREAEFSLVRAEFIACAGARR